MKEIWKDVIGYEGHYKVSNKGRVRSLTRYIKHPIHKKIRIKGKILKLENNRLGYKSIRLCKDGGSRKHFVHRLVCRAFVDNPKNKPQVNHLDANPANNCVDNLEWCTQSENIKYAYDIGNKCKEGEKNHMTHLTDKDILDIRNTYMLGIFYQREIADAYNIDQGEVSRIVNNKAWTHL
jgi:hypothetical protein